MSFTRRSLPLLTRLSPPPPHHFSLPQMAASQQLCSPWVSKRKAHKTHWSPPQPLSHETHCSPFPRLPSSCSPSGPLCSLGHRGSLSPLQPPGQAAAAAPREVSCPHRCGFLSLRWDHGVALTPSCPHPHAACSLSHLLSLPCANFSLACATAPPLLSLPASLCAPRQPALSSAPQPDCALTAAILQVRWVPRSVGIWLHLLCFIHHHFQVMGAQHRPLPRCSVPPSVLPMSNVARYIAQPDNWAAVAFAVPPSPPEASRSTTEKGAVERGRRAALAVVRSRRKEDGEPQGSADSTVTNAQLVAEAVLVELDAPWSILDVSFYKVRCCMRVFCGPAISLLLLQ